jgi:hypothetical protein
MNFYLDNGAAEFELDNSKLKFYPNNRAIEFEVQGTQDIASGEHWVLSTGIWNDNEIWDDNGIWKDNP